MIEDLSFPWWGWFAMGVFFIGIFILIFVESTANYAMELLIDD